MIVLIAIVYSFIGALTRWTRRDIATSNAAEGATALLWPLYWATQAIGWIAVGAYWTLSGAWEEP
jgi:hypothetical protein